MVPHPCHTFHDFATPYLFFATPLHTIVKLPKFALPHYAPPLPHRVFKLTALLSAMPTLPHHAHLFFSVVFYVREPKKGSILTDTANQAFYL